MDKRSIKDVYLKRKSFNSLELDDADIQFRYILKYIPEDRKAPILDAGCGNGKRALKLFNMNYSNISAVDLFESIPVKEIAYHKASIEKMPFDDASFQFAYAMSVIYYPANPETAIKEFARILKPGGVLLFSAHTKYSLFTLRRVFMRMLRRNIVKHLQDVRFRSAHEYIKWLKKNNFEIIHVDGFYLSYIVVPIYHFIVSILYNYLDIRLPRIQPVITGNVLIARIKSIFAYHMVIVAKKK